MAFANKFDWPDYLVFGLTVTASIFTGLLCSCYKKRDGTTQNYFLGNRKLSVIPVAVSLLATGVTSVDLLGKTAEMYFFGTQLIVEAVGITLAYPIAVFIVVPLFYNLKLTSVFEFLKIRYQSELLHKLGTLTFITASLVYNAINMYAPSTAFEAVTGIHFEYCLAATGLIVTVYTALGGLRGVVWTDLFQGLVLIGGLVALVTVGCEKVGGLSRVWEVNRDGDRIRFFDMNPDPFVRMTFWTAFISGFLSTLSTGALAQPTVQRFMSVTSAKKGMSIFLLKVPGDLLISALLCISGLTTYAYYKNIGCDPLEAGHISNANQIMPYFMMDVLNAPGIPGLFIAVLFSACLSTNSSLINAGVTVLWKAFVEGPMHNFTEDRKTAAVKVMTLIFGCCATGLAFVIPLMKGHVFQVATRIVGGLIGPIAGVVMTGILFPCVHWKGMVPAYVVALAVANWIAIGQQLSDLKSYLLPLDASQCIDSDSNTTSPNTTEIFQNLTTARSEPLKVYELSYMYMSLVGFLCTLILGVMCSLLMGPTKPGKVDPKTVYQWQNALCCRFCSKSTQHTCLCGYDQCGEELTSHSKDTKNNSLSDTTTKTSDFNKDPFSQADFKEATDIEYSVQHVSRSSMDTRL